MFHWIEATLSVDCIITMPLCNTVELRDVCCGELLPNISILAHISELCMFELYGTESVGEAMVCYVVQNSNTLESHI